MATRDIKARKVNIKLEPNWEGGLIHNDFIQGTMFIKITRAQRNAIPRLARSYGGDHSTACLVVNDSTIYVLNNDVATETTTDSDWDPVISFSGQTTQPIGTWQYDNTSPVLQDTDASGINGQFYYVTGAPTPTDVTHAGLFLSQTTQVLDNDMIVSVGTHFVRIRNTITWDTLNKPQVIIDYVAGTVISHIHAMSDVTGLIAALSDKYDATDLADMVLDFAEVPDAGIPNVAFLRKHFYDKTVVYTKSEIDNLLSNLTLSNTIAAKAWDWTWAEGVSGGGDTYMDFVIPTAAENEIAGVTSSIVFVDGALQLDNFSIQTTTVANDTLRLVASSADELATAKVVIFYNREGFAIPGEVPASNISYDNTTSGLAADNVQDMGDELQANINAVSALIPAHTYIRHIHVDLNNGDDANDGQWFTPLLTVEQAWTNRLLLGSGVRAVIYIHGTNSFPASLTLDATGSGSDAMNTYIIGDSSATGRYEYGPGVLTLINTGYVYFAGVGSWGTVSIQSNVWKTNVAFFATWITTNVTISGTPTKENGITAFGGFLEFNTFTGTTTNTVFNLSRGSTVWFKQNASCKNLVISSSGVELYPARTLNVTGKITLQDQSDLLIRSTATVTTVNLDKYGGVISKHATGTLTVSGTFNQYGNPWSKYHSFEPGSSGLSSTNVEDVVKEVKGLITTTAAVGHLYVHKLGNDTTGAGTIGAPFLTIQKAIDTANEGDVIHVGEGQFTEAITFKLNVVIQGETSKSYANNNGGTQIAPVTCVMDQTLADGDTGLEVTLRHVYFQATMTKTGPNVGVHIRAEHCYYDDISTLTGVISSVDARDAVFNGTADSIMCYGCQTVFVAGGGVTLSDCYQTVNFTASTISSTANMELNNCYLKGNITVGGNLTQNSTVLTGTVGVTGTHTINNQGTPAHDYKIWYVDYGLVDDTGHDGSINLPYNTIEEAFTARDADAATEGIILVKNLDGTFPSMTIGIGTKQTSLVFEGGVKGSIGKSSQIGITNRSNLRIVNMFCYQGDPDQVIDVEITQTLTNPVSVELVNSNADLIGLSINDGSLVTFKAIRSYIILSSWATTLGYLSAKQSTKLDMTSNTTVTTLYLEESYVNFTGAVSIGTWVSRSNHIVLNTNNVTYTGTWTDDGNTFAFKGAGVLVNSGGTRNIATGKFAIPDVNFQTEVIKTLDASGIAAAGTDRNLIIAANSGVADDMIELTGLSVGDKVLLRADTGDTITVIHNSGSATIKIKLFYERNIVLDQEHPLELVLVSTNVLSEVHNGEVIPYPIYSGNFVDAITSGVDKGYAPVPFDCYILDIKGQCLKTGPTGGSLVLDVNLDGTTLMTTDKITIETGETDSDDATTQPALTTTQATYGSVFSVDHDTVNGSPVAPVVILYIQKR